MQRYLSQFLWTSEVQRSQHEPLYEYDALPDKGYIRLVHLSRTLTGKLWFKLVTAKLDRSVKYEAVSYTWGDDGQRVSIFEAATGRQLRVTQNCADALESLAERRTRVLWIDAICINQDNPTERAAQVAMMDRIFECAWHTVAYIGPSDYDFRFVKAACKNGISREGPDDRDTFMESKLSAVFQRNWFSRTWVLQEVLHSSNITVQAGGELLPFYDLYKIMHRTAKRSLPHRAKVFAVMETQTDPPFFERAVNGHLSKSMQSGSLGRQFGLWQLLDILSETHGLQCRDPRDKVFAILSLFKERIPALLQPDYDQPVRRTYAKVAQYLIQRETASALSCAVGVGPQKEVPSWVTDWRDPPLRDTALQPLAAEDPKRTPVWHAGFALRQRQVVATFDEPDVASIRGKRLYKITDVQPFGAEHWEPWLAPASLRGVRHKITLDNDWIGLAPLTTQSGDVIVVFLGFEIPFVLRHRPAPDSGWLLVGECFIENIMQGQAVEDVDWETVTSKKPVQPLEDFDIY